MPTRSQLAQALFELKNEPFRLGTRKHLYPIYDMPLKQVVMIFGRQCEKSTTLGNLMVINAITHPHFVNLYVNATQNQCSDFSSDKLLPTLASPFLKEFYHDTDLPGAIFNTQIKNGSFFKLRSAYFNADRARGIPSDAVYFDEMQDIERSNIVVIEESLSHSPYKWIYKAGTPKAAGNPLSTAFNKSNMCEYVIKCPHCNTHNIIQYESVSEAGLICLKCKGVLDRFSGSWAQTRDSKLWGFRLPQVLVPHVSWEEIVTKWKDYPMTQFMNEVLALAHDESSRPVTEPDIQNCCGDYLFSDINKGKLGLTFAGLDYGRGNRSYTVFTIIEKQYHGDPKLIYAEKFKGAMANPLNYQPHVLKLVEEYRCKILGTDCGDGFMQNLAFKQALGDKRTYVFYASDNQKAFIAWNQLNQMFVHNRTASMGARFREIQLQKTLFPVWKQFEEFGKDLLAIYTDYRQNDRVVYYDHDDDTPDDFMHSYNHAIMAMKLFLGEYRVDAM